MVSAQRLVSRAEYMFQSSRIASLRDAVNQFAISGLENRDVALHAARGSMAYTEERPTVVGIADLSAADTLHVACI